jgi:hypothetical protein
MWTTLAFVAATVLIPGENGQLSLTNVRSTHGLLGVTRANDKLLPGDSLFICFDIEGIKADDSGKVSYSTAFEVGDRQGKLLLKREPQNRVAVIPLGGNRVPGFVNINVGLDQPPGEYVLKVTVTDVSTKQSQTFSRDVEVLPKAFGLVRLTTTVDPEGLVHTPVLGEGQALYVNFTAVGFARDADKHQPRVRVTMQVRDENDKPTMAKPLEGKAGEGAPANGADIPMQFLLPLNRPGKFTVDLEATDEVSNTTTKLSFPITVHKVD